MQSVYREYYERIKDSLPDIFVKDWEKDKELFIKMKIDEDRILKSSLFDDDEDDYINDYEYYDY